MTACARHRFRVIGLLIVALLASGRPASSSSRAHGPLALFFSVVATVRNYVYNIGVGQAAAALSGHTRTKTLWQRGAAATLVLKGPSDHWPCR